MKEAFTQAPVSEFSNIVSKRLDKLSILKITPRFDEGHYRVFNEDEENMCKYQFLRWNDELMELKISSEFKAAENAMKRYLPIFKKEKERRKQEMNNKIHNEQTITDEERHGMFLVCLEYNKIVIVFVCLLLYRMAKSS